MDLTEIRFRKYAGFFDWPDKPTKEVGILGDFLLSRFGDGNIPYTRFCSCELDPPDCVAETKEGDLDGYEVTELVDEKFASLWQQGKSRDYKEYNPAELRTALERISQEKDNKTFKGGPYQKIALIIFSDEPLLKTPENLEMISGMRLAQLKQIDEVYLMLRPPPKIDGEQEGKTLNESYEVYPLL